MGCLTTHPVVFSQMLQKRRWHLFILSYIFSAHVAKMSDPGHSRSDRQVTSRASLARSVPCAVLKNSQHWFVPIDWPRLAVFLACHHQERQILSHSLHIVVGKTCNWGLHVRTWRFSQMPNNDVSNYVIVPGLFYDCPFRHCHQNAHTPFYPQIKISRTQIKISHIQIKISHI